MYMIRIAVVDDEKIILDSISEKVSDIFNEYKVEFEKYNFTDGKSLIKSYFQKRFDLIFLDIDMPNITGIDIAEKLRSYDDSVEIIFVTNKEKMVYQTLKYAPFRFIRKSEFHIEIDEAIDNFLKKE